MKKILITEFMEKESVDLLASKFEVKYNPKLSDNIDNLIGEVHLYDGLIVRNKTLVNELVLSKAIKPTKDEVERNPRSRSAVMRILEKISDD